jgi:hypothetical protein
MPNARKVRAGTTLGTKVIAGMRLTGLIHSGAVTALAVGFLALLVGAGPQPRPTGGEAADPAPSERLITPDNPHNHGILNALFKRLFGNPKCEKLSHTGSEVWTVPQSRLARLEQRLLSLGIKFAVLREDWNHILRPNKAPMSNEQNEALARAKEAPAAVSAGVMRVPEAAVAEYALTSTPEHGNSRIFIPISRSVWCAPAPGAPTRVWFGGGPSKIQARPRSCSGGRTGA